MDRLRIPATKSNLIRIREELQFAREGKDLLTQKREVLVMELVALQEEAEQAREALDRAIQTAYDAFALASMMEGFDEMERLALLASNGLDLRLGERSVMGVVLPVFPQDMDTGPASPTPISGSPTRDRAMEAFFALRGRLVEVAVLETAIQRLAAETHRTLCRERALENFFIPQYAATVAYIQENLEEKERESFYQLKLVKSRRESRQPIGSPDPAGSRS